MANNRKKATAGIVISNCAITNSVPPANEWTATAIAALALAAIRHIFDLSLKDHCIKRGKHSRAGWHSFFAILFLQRYQQSQCFWEATAAPAQNATKAEVPLSGNLSFS